MKKDRSLHKTLRHSIFMIVGLFVFLSAEGVDAFTCGSDTVSQDNITYGTVVAEDGSCWLDRNLGASQVGTSKTDSNAIGWYFQWGRGADGHQYSNSSVIEGTSSSDVPGNSSFMQVPSDPSDWRKPQNDNLWQGVDGVNNPCPNGFRVPDTSDWSSVVSSAGITNGISAFNSSLKLVYTGYRHPQNASFWCPVCDGEYWTSDVSSIYGRVVKINDSSASTSGSLWNRAAGLPVRCIFEGISLQDQIISSPDSTDMNNTVINGYITLENGTIDNTDQTTTQVNITFTSNTASALFPANTIITEQGNSNYNFQNFTIQDVNVQNTAAAIDLGIPGTDLSFSQDITLTLDVGDTYNDQTLNVYSQSTGQTDWTLHTTCTVSEGDCTFTTNHATIYTAGGIPGAIPIDINVEVQDTLTLDCHDTQGTTGDYTVTLGTTTDPGKVTAGTPATGQSTCTVTTNDDQGYYLTLIDDNAATNTVLTHTDPHTGSIYEIQDLTQFPVTTTWNAPTTKGLGFSVVTFPDTQTDNNTLDETWTNTSLCPEGTNPDTNTYAGIPDTAETISAVTQYESLSTTTNICYKVDVPASQASGQYTGSVTYTATSDASSYLN